MRVVFRWSLLVGLGIALGCAPGGVATPDENQTQSQDDIAQDSGSRDASGVVAEDYWEAVYLQSAQVGYIHNERERFVEDGRPLWRTVSETRIEVLRFGEKSVQVTTVESIEDDDGRLIRFSSESAQGASPVRSHGSVDDGRLYITTRIGDQESVAQIPWDANAGGFDAVNKSLLRQPLQSGERRTVSSLVPGLDRPTPATVELVASNWELVDIEGQPRRLLRVDAGHQLAGGATMNIVAWVSDRGEIIKTEPAPGMYTVRSPAAAAQRLSQQGSQADIGRDQFVRLATLAGDLHRARRVQYRVRLNEGFPAKTFPTQRSQQVEATDDSHAAMVTVTALRPATTTIRESSPGDAYRASNPLVQSDDPRVKELAAQAVAGAEDDAARAAAIELFVHQYIEEVSFSQAFATATDVIESRSGDCTEHAVLVASLARAAGTPARVAVGLVYTQSGGQAGFAFHMWDELYVDGQWIAYDATLGLGGIGGGHIKLSDSHLADGTALASFLPVMQVMGQLRIEVVHVDAP